MSLPELTNDNLHEVGKIATKEGLGPLSTAKLIGLKTVIRSMFSQGGFSAFSPYVSLFAGTVATPAIKAVLAWISKKSKQSKVRPGSAREPEYADYSIPAVVGDVSARGVSADDVAPLDPAVLDTAIDDVLRSFLRFSPEHSEYRRGNM